MSFGRLVSYLAAAFLIYVAVHIYAFAQGLVILARHTY